MKTFIVFAGIVALATCRTVHREPKETIAIHDELEDERLQNQNAHYQFDTKIEDNINGLTHERQETRDGLSVKGHYAYSDGYVRKIVHYEADEGGYRVIGEEETPLDGPQVNLKGTASISQAAHGTRLEYQVQSIPVEEGTRIV